MENVSSDSDFMRRAMEEEGRSGSDDAGSSSRRRKRNRRHDPHQIQELEKVFKDRPHPDEKERKELGERLGLDERRVKFWFQNKRTQMKSQLAHCEHKLLEKENRDLIIENMALKEGIKNPSCEKCGAPTILGKISNEQHQLMVENTRLKEELNRLNILTKNFVFQPLPSFTIASPMPPIMGKIGLYQHLASTAIVELLTLAQLDSPMWLTSLDGNSRTLNLNEYANKITPCLGIKPRHFVTEATRATGTVSISSEALVEKLMDVKQWTEMFPCMIGRSSTINVISTGTGVNIDGAIQLMHAEFQVLSPLVRVREAKFIRHCKQHSNGLWVVVDVSVDAIEEVDYRRLPSGCVIQDMPNSYSKVTWVEHSEYDPSGVHQLFRPLLSFGLGLGAQKWIANLQRKCESLGTMTSCTFNSGDLPALDQATWRRLGELAQRMTRSFCIGVCTTVHNWEIVQTRNDDNIKIMMRKSIDHPREPSGIVLSATTTVSLPVSNQRLFNFLRDERTRRYWDVRYQENSMQRMMFIPKGLDLVNTISLLRPTDIVEAGKMSMLILQETCSDVTGSLVVYADVNAQAMNKLMEGGDSSRVALLPSGFAIFPNSCLVSNRPTDKDGGTSSSLLTLGFQILVNSSPTAKLTPKLVDTINFIIARTLQGIKAGLQFN